MYDFFSFFFLRVVFFSFVYHTVWRRDTRGGDYINKQVAGVD
jgi:hypothetical protein